MSTNFGVSEASELLNLNMENISNELSALVVGASGGGGGAGEMDAVVVAGGSNVFGARMNDAELLHCYRNHYYQQQLQQQQQQQQQQQFQAASTMYAGSRGFTAAPPPTLPTMPTTGEAKASEIAASVNSSSSSPPKFEFHYLRYQTFNKTKSNAESVPLISSTSYTDSAQEQQHVNGAAGGGASRGFRKFQKSSFKYSNNHNNDAPKLEEIDYDKVVVDLSLLGLSVDGKEKNPVLRLFALFRKMHYYLNDVLPSGGGVNDDLVYNNNMVQAPIAAPMPCTMNVQFQVKQAARKCTIFLCDMQRILNANKLYDLEKYSECERSLNGLRKLIVQFEMYKRVELEHKRGQFVTEDGRAQAERLELLLEQLNDKIRESHLYIHVFNWAMERKFKAYQQLVSDAATTLSDNAVAGLRLAGGSAAGTGGGGGGGANGRGGGGGAHLNDQFSASASGTHSPLRNFG